MRRSLIIAVVVCGLVYVRCDCPHQRTGLKAWSDASTWSASNNPNNGGNVVITDPIIVDVSAVSLADVTIQNGGMLTFSPEVDIDFRAANIYIYDKGAMEIGSEDCPYTGKLEITLTGNRQQHDGETHPKAILVDAGGTLEVHGEPRLSWTKITETLKPLSEDSQDIYFEHNWSPEYTSVNDWVNGVVAYTFTLDGSNKPVIKTHGAYDLRWHTAGLVDQINSVQDGEILMMAVQRFVRRRAKDEAIIAQVYDAYETLLYGEVTGASMFRGVQQDGSTWAFVYQKGNGDSYQEVTNPMGTTSMARFVLDENTIFTAMTVGGDKTWKQEENFRVSNRNGIQPKLKLIDDTTTWHAGDKIVIASTDYDWEQTEEREVVFCTDCANNEIRINEHVNFMHYGEVLHGAVDMRAEVALLSRQQVIKGEMESTCPTLNGNCGNKFVKGLDTFGAHIKILKGYANVHLEHFELFNVGQQTDNGRYPIHFHMCFEKLASATVPYVRGVSIHDTFARCITIHGSHGVEVIDSTCYKHMGHGFFLEDGGELNNTFDGNLAIFTLKATGTLEPVDATVPASFWITNPNTRVINNVAAGGAGTGLWFIFPDEPIAPSREFGLMDKFEAQRTMIKEFHNNVAHSNMAFGIMIGNRLDDQRKTHCCNKWQPLENPKDPLSAPIEINLSKMTAYKNRRFNVWLEGGLLNVKDVSVADSTNGIIVTNEGQQFGGMAGKLSNAVVIGDSANKGEPIGALDRSLPSPWSPADIHTGVTMWKGPTNFDHIWFDGFQPNSVYDTAAIAKKRNSPYFFSVTTPFRNVDFAFDDGAGGGNIAITGTEGVDPGWKNQDGEKISGFTWYRQTGAGEEIYYVVKPDHLSAAAADCALRENWRMAICKTKYGNIRLLGTFTDTNAVFVRDDLPSAELEFEMKTTTGPQVVLDGSRTYTIHYTGKTAPSFTRISAEGIETGDTLRVGICVPLGAEFDVQSLFPTRLPRKEFFVEVDSLAALDQSDANDGKKYYYDQSSGMVYYKFMGATTRSKDEAASCGGGKCPDFRVMHNGDVTDSDCRQRLYTAAERSMPLPTQPIFSEVIPAGLSTPPAGYGAGLTRPFTTRGVVNGGYSGWSEWSSCSKTCDIIGEGEGVVDNVNSNNDNDDSSSSDSSSDSDIGGGDDDEISSQGVQYRTRSCNNPVPQNGGNKCKGDSQQSKSCTLEPCAINGEFSQWTEWSTCTKYDLNYCAGKSVRSRTCSEPAAKFGGQMCEGFTKDIKPCMAC